MQFPRFTLIKIGCALGAMVLVNCAAISTANAQDKPPTPVGWEVRSTNTPGGGGELKSQGVSGKETPWFIAKPGPTVAGSAVINIVIVYYASAEDLAKAKQLEAEAKKKKEDEKKKKEEEKKKKKKGDSGKKDPPKKQDPPNVPTFDPRTHRLDENGKVVPIDPKQESRDPKDHQNCDKPEKFECGEHFQWWLKTHTHRNSPKSSGSQKTVDPEIKPMELQSQPRIIMTGSVVAGEDAQIRVVDGKGAFLAGVVVAMPNGQTTTTDAEGKATVKAPKNGDTMILTLAGLGVAASAWVRDSGDVPAIQTLPHLDPPSFIQPGHETPINWSGGADGQILIDGKPLNVLASSPTGCVVQVPTDLAPGTHTMALQSGGTITDVQPVESVSLSVEPPKTMMVGQKATYIVRILGTDRKMDLKLSNLNPNVSSLLGGASDGMVTSTGGKNNMAEIDVQTHSIGQVMISVTMSSFDASQFVDFASLKTGGATTATTR